MELANWWDRFGLVAGITTRDESGTTCDLRVPQGGGEAWSDAWMSFHADFRDRFPTIVVGRQVHGVEILRHSDITESGIHVFPDVDGHITDRLGCLLVVTVADCIPIYLAVPDLGMVALLHAGWRGIAGGILEQGVGLLLSAGARPRDIVAHLGVGVCGACYQVGPEVFEQLGLAHQAGPVDLDLRAHLADRGADLGLREMTSSPSCSRHDGAFHSYRRDGATAGRMAAYLGLPLG